MQTKLDSKDFNKILWIIFLIWWKNFSKNKEYQSENTKN